MSQEPEHKSDQERQCLWPQARRCRGKTGDKQENHNSVTWFQLVVASCSFCGVDMGLFCVFSNSNLCPLSTVHLHGVRQSLDSSSS